MIFLHITTGYIMIYLVTYLVATFTVKGLFFVSFIHARDAFVSVSNFAHL